MHSRFISILLVFLLLTLSFLQLLPQTVSAAYPGYNGKIVFTSDRDRGDGYVDIYITSSTPGSPVTRLTSNTGEVWDVHPAWSPDGSKIVFGRFDTHDYEIFVMNADGSNVIQLTDNDVNDYQPAWSPDGLKIAYSSNETDSNGNEDWDIWLMDADGLNKQILTDNDVNDYSPDWSPDGTKIAFARNSEIYVMNAGGTGELQLTNNSWYDALPDWSPDGSKLAFSRQSGDYPQICVMNADGSDQTEITSDNAYKWEPDWSPDGQQIVFQRNYGTIWPAGDDGKDWEISIINADGSGLINVTNNQYWDQHANWQRAPITRLNGQYSIDAETTYLGNNSWQFSYTITNLTEAGIYTYEYPLPEWCKGVDMTGMVNFFLMIPKESKIINLILPEPYTPGPYPPDSENAGWYVEFHSIDANYAWIHLWSWGPLPIYPQGESLTFSFQADDVSVGENEARMSTYFLDRYVRGLPPNLWYESYFTSLTGPIPLGPIPSRPPEQQIENIQEVFDDAVVSQDLVGVGLGNSAHGKLNALRNMLERAEELVDQGKISDAIHQLEDAYKRVDGNPKPPDFAGGDEADNLADLILSLIDSLQE